MGKKENEIGGNDAVCTPASVYEPVLQALGHPRFTLDPCSHPDALVPTELRVLLPGYDTGVARPFTIYGNGLDVDWTNHDVWLNPPYSQLQYFNKYLWLRKCAEEAYRAVAFLPSRTSSGWWHEGILNCPQADILVQLRGRVRHIGHEYGSPFHQVLVGYGLVDAMAKQREWTEESAEENVLERWRAAFKHGEPRGAFVSNLRQMRAA